MADHAPIPRIPNRRFNQWADEHDADVDRVTERVFNYLCGVRRPPLLRVSVDYDQLRDRIERWLYETS